MAKVSITAPVAGLLCLGYPFHPPGKRERPQTAHLRALATPNLICHGTRDPFGAPDDVAEYALTGRAEVLWVEDGDHSSRASGSPASRALTERIAPWVVRLAS